MSRTNWLVGGAVVIIIIGVFFVLRKDQVVDPSGPRDIQQTQQDVTVSLGIATWPGFAAGMIGSEQGYFEGITLKHQVLDDATSRHAAFKSGAIDVMISSADVFAQEVELGIKGKILLVTDESTGGDGIIVKPSINSVEDLKGKTIAFARGTPSHYLLYTALKEAGLSISDVNQQIVEDPGQAGNAFIGGNVDAAVTWEPLLSEVASGGEGKVLLTSADYPGTIVDILVVSESLASQDDVLKSFISGWMKSVDFIRNNPDEAAEIIANGLNLPSEDVQGMMMGLTFADETRNKDFFASIGNQPPSIIQEYLDAASLWKEDGVINEIPPVENLITPSTIDIFKND